MAFISLRRKRNSEMETDRLSDDWAIAAMKKLDSVVSDWNAANPTADPIRIVWGFADTDAEENERKLEDRFQRQHGLLNWKSFDFDLFIEQGLVGEYEESEIRELESCAGSLACVRISIRFPEVRPLPRSAPTLYNALVDCGTARPVIAPMPDNDDPNNGEILVLGIDIHVVIENLNFRVLSHHLADLWWSSTCLRDRLLNDFGYDAWNEDPDDGGT